MNVRDMTYDVEDVIDQFMYHVNRQRIGVDLFGSFTTRFTFHVQTLWVRHQSATKLQKIKSIPEVNQRYGVTCFLRLVGICVFIEG